MNTITPFLSVTGSADETSRLLRTRLAQAGLRVLQTFDLSDARGSAPDCPCPLHGQAACDCEMVVLLVYTTAGPPVSVILHSNDGLTWLSLVDTPAQQAEPSVRLSIEFALQPNPHQEGL